MGPFSTPKDRSIDIAISDLKSFRVYRDAAQKMVVCPCCVTMPQLASLQECHFDETYVSLSALSSKSPCKHQIYYYYFLQRLKIMIMFRF